MRTHDTYMQYVNVSCPAGGSQGDIYQIKKTVEELNALYQVRVQRNGHSRCMSMHLYMLPLEDCFLSGRVNRYSIAEPLILSFCSRHAWQELLCWQHSSSS